MRTTIILSILAAVAAAEPPASKGFARADDLLLTLADNMAKLKEAEEFAKKSRPEKMLIAFERGEKKFDKQKLTGETVVEAILEWEEVLKDEPSEEAVRVLARMGEVLEKKYARVVEIPKLERLNASKPLVDALTDKRLHIRFAAIEALKKIYRTQNGHFYQPDMPAKERKDKQKVWARFIKKESRR